MSAPSDSDLESSLFSRTGGLIDRRLASRRVVLVGAGSVGSYMAESLVRSGIRRLAVMDPDTVEATNLGRTVYTMDDIGQSKISGLRRRLSAIRPHLEMEGDERSLLSLDASELAEWLRGADLVIAATDDPRAQSMINRFCGHLGVPSIYVGIYRVARGGEVILSLPGTTPCYQCATGGRREAESLTGASVERSVDYGSGRLEGEIALGCDIHHISSAGVKLALSLLSREDERVALSRFATDAVEMGFPMLTLSTTPNFWFYPRLFGDTPGQYAYQGVWLSFASRPECSVCGDPSCREDPLEHLVGAPDRDSLRTRLSQRMEGEAAESPVGEDESP